MNIEKGYLFITDITGHTEFLTQSELYRAREILDAKGRVLDTFGTPVVCPLT